MAGQDRWERAVLSGQSAIATALICIVVLVTLPLLKMLVRLGALVGLASLYINNPCREPSTHNKAWEMLLAERRRRIGERNAKDVSNLNVLSLIKNAVNDTTGLISGQRVMCDFVFFSFAYIDSESGVDAEYFALGAMGSWRIVEMAVLRRLATSFAMGLDGISSGIGGDGGTGSRAEPQG